MSDSITQIEEQLTAAGSRSERVSLLNKLAFACSRVDPMRGLKAAAEAEALAVKLEDVAGRAESLRVAAWCHETLSDYPKAMSMAEEARSLFRRIGDEFSQGSCLNLIGVIAFGMNRYAAALEALDEAKRLFSKTGDSKGVASAYNNIGMIHQDLGMYPEALEAYLAALRINEELGEERSAAVNIGNVSNVYYYLGDHVRSFEYDQRALAVARKNNDLYNIAHALESIASNYKEQGDNTAALDALNEALEIFRQLQEKRYEAAALVKIGTINELSGEPKQALEQYKQAAKIAESIGRRDALANAQLHIGLLHAKQGRHKSAVPVLRKALALANELEMRKLESELLLALSNSLDAIGEHAEAFTCMKAHAQSLEPLYGEERQRVVAEMQARFNVEQAEREREVFRLKSEHLEEMMDLRSKELTSMAMHLVQKNAFLQKLRKDALKLSEEYPASKDVLDTLLKAILENLHGEDEWQRFEQEFQLIHHDFLNRLSQRCPRLTPAELKVCAMLKINLSNKEIANLLSVSLRNVESHRYSIRKKLGLDSETNLTGHLVAI